MSAVFWTIIQKNVSKEAGLSWNILPAANIVLPDYTEVVLWLYNISYYDSDS